MNKKIFTLFVLLLLLPVTALAAEEIKLFIGGQQITENGCYANQNGTWTKVDGTEPANGQFYYDAATFTLTLNKAEITNNQTVNVAEGYTYDGSVIAFSQTADVSLNHNGNRRDSCGVQGWRCLLVYLRSWQLRSQCG